MHIVIINSLITKHKISLMAGPNCVLAPLSKIKWHGWLQDKVDNFLQHNASFS
jgi:hypothetical protein